MFDVLNPQKRERLLIIAAGSLLCAVVLLALPVMLRETVRLKGEQKNFRNKVDELELHALNKEEIQNRLIVFAGQALASSSNTARSGYEIWLGNLAKIAGLREETFTLQNPGRTALKGAGMKHTFTVTGTGRLDQIAEFLRRFHRTEYLHLIQSVSPRPSTKNPGEFDVTIKIEALELPQVRTVKIPSITGEDTAITDEERQMLAAIRSRAILSAYTPQQQPPPNEGRTQQQPVIDFDDSLYCFVNGIVEVEGKPQCWIDYRTEGRKYFLFEGESFRLGSITCTVKKIERQSDRVQIAAAGGVYAVKLGKSIGQSDESCYFLTGIVDAEGQRWAQDSVGEPCAVIVYGSETEDTRGNVRIVEFEKYTLSKGNAFPMAEVLCTIVEIVPASNQVQIEATGTVYDIRVGGSFAEFGAE